MSGPKIKRAHRKITFEVSGNDEIVILTLRGWTGPSVDDGQSEPEISLDITPKHASADDQWETVIDLSLPQAQAIAAGLAELIIATRNANDRELARGGGE